MDPKEILQRTRALITAYAGGDPDQWWYANRFVFAGLMWDERHSKSGIKERLLAGDSLCHHCGKEFAPPDRVCLHRVDPGRAYSQANCVLMHLACHKDFHAAEWEQARASHAEVAEAPPDDERVEAVLGGEAAGAAPDDDVIELAAHVDAAPAAPDDEVVLDAEPLAAAPDDEIMLDTAAFDTSPIPGSDDTELNAEPLPGVPDVEAVGLGPEAEGAQVVPHTEDFGFAPDAEAIDAARHVDVPPAAEDDEIVLDVSAFEAAPGADEDTVLEGEPLEADPDAEAAEVAPAAEGVLDHVAEPGNGESFLHQWDITPAVKAALDKYGDVAFICYDTRRKASVPVETLKAFLTPERQTTRGEGNWGVRILVGHEDELAFEPGPDGGEWLTLPVEWSDH